MPNALESALDPPGELDRVAFLLDKDDGPGFRNLPFRAPQEASAGCDSVREIEGEPGLVVLRGSGKAHLLARGKELADEVGDLGRCERAKIGKRVDAHVGEGARVL